MIGIINYVGNMNENELRGLVLDLLEDDSILYNVLSNTVSGVNTDEYKFRLSLAIGNPLYWQDENSYLEEESNENILLILSELKPLINRGLSLDSIGDILYWLIYQLNDNYINSINGEINVAILEAFKLFKCIGEKNNRYYLELVNLICDLCYSFEGSLSDELKNILLDIFKGLKAKEVASLIDELTIIDSDIIKEALIRAAILDEVLELIEI